MRYCTVHSLQRLVNLLLIYGCATPLCKREFYVAVRAEPVGNLQLRFFWVNHRLAFFMFFVLRAYVFSLLFSWLSFAVVKVFVTTPVITESNNMSARSFGIGDGIVGSTAGGMCS